MDGPVPTSMQKLFKYAPPVRDRFRAEMMDFRESMYDAVTGPGALTDEVKRLSQEMMKRQLPDQPDLWKKLTPEYPLGCKRIIVSDDYFPALNQPHVSLETSPIKCITEDGIEVEDGSYSFDLIILATGFRTLQFMYPITVRGSAGRDLAAIWRGGATALYGVTVESLPNFGMLYGPNTNLGHNSIILMIEAQSRYLNGLISPVLKARSQGKSFTIRPKSARVQAYNEAIQQRLNKMSFAASNCQSWYKTEEGLITNNWAGTVVEYQKQLSAIDWADYDVSGSGAEEYANGKLQIGRVVEETILGRWMLGLTAASVLAIAGGLALRAPRLLKAR